MSVYETPGVYFERSDAVQSRILGLRTDIAGFVGIAERGPGNLPIPIDSWRQFEAYFGGFIGSGYLAYAVRAFFENGGRRCWVVRVISDATTTAQISLNTLTPPAAATWQRIEAISPGVWGNDLQVTLQEIHRAQSKTIPAKSQADVVAVEAVGGFERLMLVRLIQGSTSAFRVIDSVDAAISVLRWKDPFTAFDLSGPILIESIEYTILVHSGGRLIRTYERLSLIPGNPRFGPYVLPSLKESLKELLKSRNRNVLPVAAAEPIAIIEPKDVNAIQTIYPFDLSLTKKPGGGTQPFALLQGGSDGLVALRTVDFTGEEVSPEEYDTVRERKERGITALNKVDEVAIVAVPESIFGRYRLPRVRR